MENILILTTIVSFSLYLYNLVTCQKNLQEKLLKNRKMIQKMRESNIQQKVNQNKINLLLHDKLGANLSALKLRIHLIKKHVPEQEFNTISNLLCDSIQETRKISKKIDIAQSLRQIEN